MTVPHHVLVPQPVSSLSMTPLGNGRTLMLSWTPPRGDWENYSILLRNGSEVLVNRTISKPSRQHAFSTFGLGLVPGRLYGAEVTVHSGSLSNTVRCEGRLGQFTSSPSVTVMLRVCLSQSLTATCLERQRKKT